MTKKILDDSSPDVKTDPVASYVPVTPGASDLPDGVCRGLLVGTAGTANLTERDGTDRDNVPLQQGYNPIIVRRVRTGGTASDIWALY